MKDLILIGALVMTLPVVATAESERAAAPASPEVVTRTVEPSQAEAAAPAIAAPEPAKPPVPESAVARGTFATAIDHREPVDRIDSLASDHDRVFYFTEFVGVSGRELTHRWAFEGEVVAEVPIAVGGPRWRAYSSKTLDPSRLGEWTVSVVDESGHVVHTDSFTYEAAAAEPETTASEPVPAAPAPAAARDASDAIPAPTQPD